MYQNVVCCHVRNEPNLSSRIKDKALRLGLDLAGIAPASPSAHAGAVRDWLAAGHHGEMGWLARDPGGGGLGPAGWCRARDPSSRWGFPMP